MNYFNFTEIMDKSVFLKEELINSEKLKGRFKLHIKRDLPTPL
jgi:hypothetical protein